MTNEVLIQTGFPAYVAATALSKGDLVTLNASGQFAKTAAGATTWFVVLKDAAIGDLVTGVRATVMYAAADATAAIAVGDKLEVGAGVLAKLSMGVEQARALDALASGTGLIRVLTTAV